MQIFHELNENFNLSLALGYFDGVHKGHQKVIKSAVNYAQKNNTKSAVITFQDHPCCYLWGVCPKYILTRKMREEKLEELGVDYVYELDFEKIHKLSANEYLKDILIKYFKPVSISAGWNHNFGCDKSGNGEILKINAQEYGYKYFEIEPIKYRLTNFNSHSEQEILRAEALRITECEESIYTISSTKIREYLTNGQIETANDMLGYKFTVKGEVIKGRQIGRTIGFKTANINYPTELISIPYGAYSADVNVEGQKYKGVANFGIRPTVNGSNAILEVHILDFDKDIYGETIEIEFIRLIRLEQKFNSLDDLKIQIEKDIKSVR